MGAQGFSRRRRLLVLAICCMSLFIAGLDSTIVNVALPSIQRDLHAPVSDLQWTVDAYTLVLASFLILSGSTGDRVGRRRIFQTGLVLFILGSLLCSLAPGLGWLVAFRVLQAIGGSMLNPVALSIISNIFTDPAERARAIGIWGSVFGVSLALGPVLGGALIASVGWRGIFWVNVPVGLAALVLSALFVPESRAPRARGVDRVGQLLVITMLASLIYAIIEAPGAGWTSARTLGFFGVAAAAFTGLIYWEPRRDEPLIDLRFFRSAPFSGATVIAVCAFAALGGFLFLNTLYLQDVRGYSALHAGLFMLPMAAMIVVCAPLSGRILAARGPRLPLVSGRPRDHGQRRHADPASHRHPGELAHHVLPGSRRRDRDGEPRDHQYGRVRHAPIAGGGRGRDRLDQPPGRHRARRRRDGIGRALRAARATPARFCRRQPRGLVDHRRMRGRGPTASDHHHRPVGQGDSGTSGQPDRAGQPQGPRVLMKGSAIWNSFKIDDRFSG